MSTPNPASHYAISDSSDILSAITTTGINLAVWKRAEIPACNEALAAIFAAQGPIEIDLKPVDRTQIIPEILASTESFGAQASMKVLAEDIRMLVDRFCEVTGNSHARIRISRVEDNGCQLFHADTLHMRLICIYAGAGTEWLENDNARYNELGSKGRSVAETNNTIVINPAQIRRIATWHVAMLSGRRKTGTPPLIHRSAPVHSNHEHRIRLCIDFPHVCGC
ncbi:MAG: DUF1826 domain-containing protein [Kiritimatiellaceae bacterium]|nr:DUF1826 domain-containing protein [Kiritimatiellaceae bacterium]